MSYSVILFIILASTSIARKLPKNIACSVLPRHTASKNPILSRIYHCRNIRLYDLHAFKPLFFAYHNASAWFGEVHTRRIKIRSLMHGVKDHADGQQGWQPSVQGKSHCQQSALFVIVEKWRKSKWQNREEGPKRVREWESERVRERQRGIAAKEMMADPLQVCVTLDVAVSLLWTLTTIRDEHEYERIEYFINISAFVFADHYSWSKLWKRLQRGNRVHLWKVGRSK